MVKYFFLLFLCLTSLSSLIGAPIIDVSIDSIKAQAHFPIQGTITITHTKEEIIDSQSFSIEGDPLDVSLIKNVHMTTSSNTLVSIYQFQLPAKEGGSYLLSPVSIKIGKERYSSSSTPYEVKMGEKGEPPTISSLVKSSTPPLFKLEASVIGPKTLYPGERTTFFYRILYNESIDLTHSELPMIHPAHFKKVGDVHIKDYQLNEEEKGTTVQEITQEVEASELGTFSFGPSTIEGYSYTIQSGQKVYNTPLLKATAPIITIAVNPPPESLQPISFNGALGKIHIEARLNGSPVSTIGDLLQLNVKITGVTNLTDLSLPLLECQPGFSGFFQMSNTPPLSEIKENAKFFYVELRPLTSLIDQIPSIEVSSWDPLSLQYIVQKSSPIHLKLTNRSSVVSSRDLKEERTLPILAPLPSPIVWPIPSLLPLKTKENQISLQIKRKSHWTNENEWVLGLILGITFLFIQLRAKKKWNNHLNALSQMPQSERLFKQALKKENLYLLEEAFWVRLWEKGIIPQKIVRLEELPDEEKFTAIRYFIVHLEALQYSADQKYDFSDLKKIAKIYFDLI